MTESNYYLQANIDKQSQRTYVDIILRFNTIIRISIPSLIRLLTSITVVEVHIRSLSHSDLYLSVARCVIRICGWYWQFSVGK